MSERRAAAWMLGAVRGLSPAGWVLICVNGLLGWNLLPNGAPNSEAGPAQVASSAFSLALEDSKIAEEREVSHTLIAIKQDSPGTTWAKVGEDELVLTAVFTAFDGYNSKVGQSMCLKQAIWVTPVPQLREKCRAFDASGYDGLTLRLRQYLGLLPEGRHDRVVELWVRPSALFRPCPDPEITDDACRVGLPDLPPLTSASSTAADAACPASDPAELERQAREHEATAKHAQWFKEQFDAYSKPNAMPWTRLGYTYDWGSPDHVGASEYIIPAGTVVHVSSVSSVQDYCSARAREPARSLPGLPVNAADGGVASVIAPAPSAAPIGGNSAAALAGP